MLTLDSYAEIVGKKYIDQLRNQATKLMNKKILMINSTMDGGGVAEILNRLIPLINELGINCEWKVIDGDNDFFNITKKIHNSLQGRKIPFSKEEIDYYLEVNKKNAKELEIDADIVIIHDPQPLPLIKYYNDGDARWVWRCHIDMSKPDIKLWRTLKNFLLSYDASIFSISKFSKPLPHPQYLIAPSIDPLSDKNKYLDKNIIDGVLVKHGIKKDKPIILQVSRFDKFKDPIGVIQGFKLVKKELDCQLILAGGTASDDPEGDIVLQEVRQEAGDEPDIHVLSLEPKSDITINALQRAADVVVQKSLKEGFGLVVTEAMWKEKPVVGGSVGGITIQLNNNQTGFLVNSVEGTAYRIRYLLNRPEVSKNMGIKAKSYVTKNFLITRHLRDYLSLFIILDNPGKNIIYI